MGFSLILHDLCLLITNVKLRKQINLKLELESIWKSFFSNTFLVSLVINLEINDTQRLFEVFLVVFGHVSHKPMLCTCYEFLDIENVGTSSVRHLGVVKLCV